MRFALLLLATGVGISGIASAQDAAPLGNRITGILSRMANKDGPTSNAAFDEMLGVIAEDKSTGVTAFGSRHPEEADRVKLGFIAFLDNFNRGNLSYPPTYDPEEISDHYAQAIDVVSCLHDERAIPALVGAMGSGAGSCRGLLQFGKKALGAVLNELKNPDPIMRKRAVEYGVAILKTDRSPAAEAEVLTLLRSSLSDAEFLLRATAIEQIDILNKDPQYSQVLQQFVPTLQQMSISDPFIVPSSGTYLLRVRATELLQKLGNR